MHHAKDSKTLSVFSISFALRKYERCTATVSGEIPPRRTSSQNPEHVSGFVLSGSLTVGFEKRSGVPSEYAGSRAADTRKIFDGKFLLAEESFPAHKIKRSQLVLGFFNLYTALERCNHLHHAKDSKILLRID